MDLERAVAVGEEEGRSLRGVVVEKGDVGRQEALAIPGGLRGDVFTGRVDARLHRGLAIPDRLAVERQLGEALGLLVAADIEKLLAPLAADFDAVAAPLKLAAEGPDESSRRIEDEDRGMVLPLPAALVDHV